MEEPDRRAAAEEAWDAVSDLLDEDTYDDDALALLEAADAALSLVDDDDSRERHAQVLEGLVSCHATQGTYAAAAAAANRLLGGEWPDEALPYRLSAAYIVVASQLLDPEPSADVAMRAVELGQGSDDGYCRARVADLLKLGAETVHHDDPVRARTLLTRLIDEFGDVDEAVEAAQAHLSYLRARDLVDESGPLEEAEGALRRAVDGGYDAAWLELALVLSWQPAREDDEQHALLMALDAETDPERLAIAGLRLGQLLHYHRGDRAAAREAFGRASTGDGNCATMAVQELAILASLDGDREAHRQLIHEFAGRALEEFDADARHKDYPVLAAASRAGYARPFIAGRAWRWRRARRREQRRRTR